MRTPFDLISLIVFAGLAVLFLQRSASRDADPVAVWKYAVAALGCVAGDLLGNADQALFGWAMLSATGVYSVVFLKPFKTTGR